MQVAAKLARGTGPKALPLPRDPPNTEVMSTRPNRVLAIVVGAVVVLALVVAALSATRPVTTYDEATPEGVVQSYLTAALKGDNDQAATYFATDGLCDAADLDRASIVDSQQVYLVDTEVDGDSARVQVQLVVGGGGPLDTSEYSEDQVFRLTRSAEGWRLTGTPWPLWDCEGGVK